MYKRNQHKLFSQGEKGLRCSDSCTALAETLPLLNKAMKHLTVFLFALMMLSSTAIMADNQPASNTKNATFFIENKGQWPDEVLFLARLHGLNAWVTKTGVTYDHFKFSQIETRKNFAHLSPREKKEAERNNYSIQGHVVKFSFIHGNENPFAKGDKPSPAMRNYFLGNDPDKWATGVSLFGQVEIEQVVDDISVVYYFEQENLRYDYHVSPGADVRKLRFLLEGTNEWQVNELGELEIGTNLGIVNHGKIYAYQNIDGKDQEVFCSFVQLADGSLGMTVREYDPALPLIIDPMVFSTYLGGNEYESNPAVAVGQDGSVYITGESLSPNFPITPGAYQTTKKAEADIIISKMNASASTLMFSTFLGGDGREELPDISLGADGSVYVMGTTVSNNFPVTEGVIQDQNPGEKSVFISRLNADGSSLIFSTYLGGDYNDSGSSIITDTEGNAYISGNSYSEDFPVTPGTLDFNGGIFITKINPSASELIFSTFVAPGNGRGMVVDDAGNIFIVGDHSGDGTYIPITPGAFQTVGTGSHSSFAMVINPAASQVLASTYITGDYIDYGEAICVAENGDIIVGGTTRSQDFPTSTDAFQPTNQGNTDVFVIRLNASCTQMIWGTLLGTFDGEELYGMALDADENVVITGETYAGLEFPVTTDEFVVNMPFYFDPAFISQISNDGTQLLYSAVLANPDVETQANDVVVNDNGNFVVAGNTGYGFPITPDVFQPNHEGGWKDFFISEILPFNCQTECQVNIINHVSCFGGSDGKVQALPSGGIAPYTYLWSDGQTTQIAENLLPGSYSVTIADAMGCAAEASFVISEPSQIQLEILGIYLASCADSPDGSATVQAVGGTPPYNYLWGNGETGQTANNLTAGENTITVTDTKNCQENLIFEIDYIQPFEEEEICAVGVNPETGKNTILWQRTEGERIVAYNIYREGSASGIYELAGSRLFDETPEFEDVEANPAQQSYRYKIAVVDSCQEESAMSDFHKTIHLSMNTGVNNEVNLLWTAYEGFTYPTHYILRSINDGPFAQIGLVPSSNLSFTDLTPPSGTKKYMIEIEAPADCNVAKSNTRIQSNTVVLIPTSIDENANQQLFRVYPNPADKCLEIETAGFKGFITISLLNVEGQKVLEQQISSNKTILNLENIKAGVYILLLKKNGLLIESEKIVVK